MNEAWYLEGYVDGESHPRRIGIHTSPFRIGRTPGPQIHCVLPCRSLSHVHAELRFNEKGLWIRDANSSNGTFVNRKRVSAPTRVRDGDVVHLAKSEFVVLRVSDPLGDDETSKERTQLSPVSVTQLPRRTVSGIAEFRELLKASAVRAVFQPIVSIESSAVTDFEILGRGEWSSLPTAPYDLFQIAASIDSEAQLSRLFEQAGFRDATELPANTGLFVNLHPTELEGEQFDSLLNFLTAQRGAASEKRIVVEIHESAVLVRSRMIRLVALLKDLGIDLAYDDFGAGQARLIELTEVPCRYLKFDRLMIAGIDKAPTPRQRLLASLVRMASELGIECLAEGVESAAEWTICCDMGFTYGQGYYFGKPAKASDWTESALASIEGLIGSSRS